MKRLRSNANLGRKKYSRHPHVEHTGIGTRQLSPLEIEEMQAQIERIRNGQLMRPIRLPVTV